MDLNGIRIELNVGNVPKMRPQSPPSYKHAGTVWIRTRKASFLNSRQRSINARKLNGFFKKKIRRRQRPRGTTTAQYSGLIIESKLRNKELRKWVHNSMPQTLILS